MARFNEIINNFINGEVSPKIYGRMDSEIYKRSCRELKNMLVHPQGGAGRRVGTQFVTDNLPAWYNDYFIDIEEGARIVPFVFSSDEKYLIVFNKFQDSNPLNYIHFYHVEKDTWTATGASNVIASWYGPQTARSSTNLSTALASTQLQDSTVLEEMQYTQAGAVMTFVHESFPPFCIIRTAPGVLNFVPYTTQFIATASSSIGPLPFMDLNLSDVTLTTSATAVGTGVTMTASAAMFNASHVGAMFAFQNSSVVGACIVTGYTSTTVVTVEIIRTLPAVATSGTKNWYEGAWSNYRGWPRTVAYWDSSLFFGGSPTFPDRIWRSQKFDIFEMTNATVLDPGGTPSSADPFYGDLAVGQNGVSTITFLANTGRDLIAGCTQKEVAISAFDLDTITVNPQTGYGAEYIQPIMVDEVPIYVQRGYRKLREIVFDERQQGYIAPDVTFLAEHMPRKSKEVLSGTLVAPKIKRLAYQALDNNILWAIDNNGLLFGCTKSRDPQVTAFHYHDVGGYVRDIVSLGSKDGAFDELYMIVERTIDGATKYFIEKLSGEFYEETLNEGADEKIRVPVFTDSSKLFRRSTANFWAQLKDSVNATIADGSTTGTETGTITYDYNKAVFDGSSYITYDGTDNADFAQVGCIRFYCDFSTTNNTIFSISQSAASTNNLIRLRTDGSNNLKLTINDSTGSAIINDVTLGLLSDYIYFADSLIQVEINYDLTTGATRVFLNGEQIGSTIASTGTRTTAIDNIKIGAHYNGTDGWVGCISDFQIFDSVQHTADFVPYEYQPLGVTLYKLDHLEGETVAVTANGIYVGDFVVSGGEIADIGADYTTYETIVVGKKYTHLLEIQPIDLGSGIGSAMGAIKRIDRAVVRFRDSAAARVGPDVDNVEDLIFRDNDTPMNEPIALVTDDKELDFIGDYDRVARAVITHDAPLPCNVTCLSLRGVEADV